MSTAGAGTGSHPARPRAAWRAGSTDPRRRAAPASLEPSALLHRRAACSFRLQRTVQQKNHFSTFQIILDAGISLHVFEFPKIYEILLSSF